MRKGLPDIHLLKEQWSQTAEVYWRPSYAAWRLEGNRWHLKGKAQRVAQPPHPEAWICPPPPLLGWGKPLLPGSMIGQTHTSKPQESGARLAP